jgi:hypothetical protein
MSRLPAETRVIARVITRALKALDRNDRAFTGSTISYEAYEESRRVILRLVHNEGQLSAAKEILTIRKEILKG